MSELSAYISTPEKEPRHFAEDILNKMCPNCAIESVNLLLRQGLLMPLNQYQIEYYNKVLDELNNR